MVSKSKSSAGPTATQKAQHKKALQALIREASKGKKSRALQLAIRNVRKTALRISFRKI
jgi:hypothetical protein